MDQLSFKNVLVYNDNKNNIIYDFNDISINEIVIKTSQDECDKNFLLTDKNDYFNSNDIILMTSNEDMLLFGIKEEERTDIEEDNFEDRQLEQQLQIPNKENNSIYTINEVDTKEIKVEVNEDKENVDKKAIETTPSRRWIQETKFIKTLEGEFSVPMWVYDWDKSLLDTVNDHYSSNQQLKLDFEVTKQKPTKQQTHIHQHQQLYDITNKKNKNKLKTIKCTNQNCDKYFSTMPSMRKHLHRHGPRIYVCAECGKSFLENTKLKRHQLVHTGEKPFKCNFVGCNKKFSLDFNLRTHMRIHTGERPYKCPIMNCNKKFVQSTNLKSHINTHFKNKLI